MKKARIILTSVVVLAVIGGALAFKVKGTNTFFYEKDNDDKCNDRTVINYTPTILGGFTTELSEASTETTCPVIEVTTFN